MRKVIAIILVLFLGCATTQKKVEPPVPETKKEILKEPEIVQAKSIKDIKDAIIKSRFYSEKGKTVFYSSSKKNATEAKKRLMKQFSNSLSAEEIGFDGYKKEEIVSQLDSRNIPVFIAIDSKNGEEIVVEVYSVESGAKESIRFLCPFLTEEKSAAEFVMNIFTEPKTVSAGSKGEIYIFDGKKITLVNVFEKNEKTVDVLVCSDAVLSNFGEGAVCFCPQNGKGFKLVHKDGKTEKVETAGYPLPERVLRFISVEKDENGNWALTDRKGDILGQFINLSKTVFRETSVFLALSPKGEIWGVRGDLVEPIYANEKIIFKEITSSESVAFGLSQSGDLYKMIISKDFSIVLEKKQIDISEELVEIVAVENELYGFAKAENGFKLYRIYLNGE